MKDTQLWLLFTQMFLGISFLAEGLNRIGLILLGMAAFIGYISFSVKEKGDYTGIIGVWRSIGGGKKRYYIKLAAKDFNVAKNLLTVLLWNFEQDLYVKLRKDSKFVSAFKNKGFRFKGGRGCQILLYRKFVPQRKKNERKFNDDRDSSEVFARRNSKNSSPR